MAKINLTNLNTIPKVTAQAEAVIAETMADYSDIEASGRFDTQFVPSKKDGEKGRYLVCYIDENGSRDVCFDRSFPDESAALSAGPACFPGVVLSEGTRVSNGLEAALATFLASCRRTVVKAKEMTAALLIAERDGVSINEALGFVKGTIEIEKADASKDAVPVATADTDDVFGD